MYLAFKDTSFKIDLLKSNLSQTKRSWKTRDDNLMKMIRVLQAESKRKNLPFWKRWWVKKNTYIFFNPSPKYIYINPFEK